MKIRAALQEPDAAIPAQDAVIIAGRADFLGSGEAAHGFFDVREECAGIIANEKLCFGAAFEHQACVVGLLVRIVQTLENRESFGMTVTRGTDELVGDGETKEAEGELVLGINGENVAADGFGFFGLVDVAVEAGFVESLGDAGFGNGF